MVSISVFGDDYVVDEFVKNIPHLKIIIIDNNEEKIKTNYFFILTDKANNFDIDNNTIVFYNSQIPLKNKNRINTWHNMLNRNIWEIASDDLDIEAMALIFQKKINTVPTNTIGFPSTRIITTIINEAIISLNEGISTKENINIAMKLGTNYPHGPFEWYDLIGKKNVDDLLFALSKENEINAKG